MYSKNVVDFNILNNFVPEDALVDLTADRANIQDHNNFLENSYKTQ